MARSKIPGPLERRHLLEKDLDAAQAQKIADAYLEEGRAPEAIAFLEKAEAGEALETLAAEAVASGDAFLLRAACGALGNEPTSEQWQQLAQQAEAAGKEIYAGEARRHAELQSS